MKGPRERFTVAMIYDLLTYLERQFILDTL